MAALTRAEILLSAKDVSKAAFASVSKNFDNLKANALSVKAGVATLGGALAGALAVSQAKGGIDLLDQLDDLSEKSGISVEKLSELRFAGEAVGTPIEALAGGVQRLSKQMAEAAGGNKEAIATFKTLGVEVRNADGSLRSSDAVLGDLADRFASYEDGAGKAALAQRIFGKSGAELIPLLNQGSQGIEKLRTEAQALGAIYGGDLAKEAATFNDNLVKLRVASEAAAISVAGPFLKSLIAITDQMIEAKKQGGLLNAILVAIGGGVARTLGVDEIGQAQSRAKQATAEMQRIQNMMVGVELTLERDPGNEVAQKRLTTYRTKIQDLQKTASAASEELKALANAADPANDPNRRKEERGFTPSPADAKKTAAPVIASGDGSAKKAKDEQADAKRYLESLDKQLEKKKELSAVETALTELQRIRQEGGKVPESLKQEILLRAAAIDAAEEQAENAKKQEKEREEAQQRYISLQDEGRRVQESTRTPLESYNAEMARLIELQQQGVISSETFARATLRASEDLSEGEKRVREAANAQDDYAKRAVDNIQDSIGSGLADALDGNFKNIGNSFGKMLNRMVAEAIAADLARNMFGDLAGGEGEGLFGGILKTFTSALNGSGGKSGGDPLGSFIKANGIGGDAGGGGGWLSSLGGWASSLMSFDVGTDYVPEDMIAKIHKGERIVPAAENRANGGGRATVVHLTQNFPAGTSSRTTDQAALQAGRAIERARRNA